MPVSAFDVSAYILSKCSVMTHMKLQKLLYYSQAWSLVWDDEPLFNERIEAWVNGPVVPEIFGYLRQKYGVTKGMLKKGSALKLKSTQRETVDAVLKHYGQKTSQWLSDLTHMEDPWKNAREGLGPRERGNRVISHADMALYYSEL